MKKQSALTPSSYLNDLNGAVRDNPVAAGVIGMGILWMFFGRTRIPALAASAATMAGSAAAAGARGVRVGVAATASAVSETAAQGYSKAERLAENAGQIFQSDSDHAPKLSEGSNYYAPASNATNERWRRVGESVQQTISSALERQPLLLGAFGLAAGAAIAAAFKSTELEKAMMAEAAGTFRHQAADLVDGAVDLAKSRTSSALHAMAEEATAQGFTASNVKDQLAATAQKAKNVASGFGRSAPSASQEMKDITPAHRF